MGRSSGKKNTYISKGRGLSDRDRLEERLMLSVPFLLVLLFVIVPFILILWQSFFDYYGFGTKSFVGISNYVKAFTSTDGFWRAVSNSFIYTFGKLIVEIPLALFLAVILTGKIRGSSFFKAFYLLPFVLPTAVIGVVFRFLFSHQYGTVNQLLTFFSLRPVMWFSERSTALIVTMLCSLWQNLGLNTAFFVTGLVGIEDSYYEAAALDGATGRQSFRSITLPMLRPVFLIVTVNAILGSLKETDLFLTLSNGSPAGKSEVIMTYIYKMFFGIGGGSSMNFGLSSALAVIASIILAVIAALYIRVSFKQNGNGLRGERDE